MIYRLVWENLKHRPVRTFLSAIFIGIQVTLILTLVGLSDGVMGDIGRRSEGSRADIIIRPPNSTAFNLSGTVPEKIVATVRARPHVALATGTLVESVGNFENITGIRPGDFNAMSGGFHFYEGDSAHAFLNSDDLLIDDEYARSKNLHRGSIIPAKDLGRPWRVSGVVEQGMLGRLFADMDNLQDLYGVPSKISIVYVKVDDPNNISAVVGDLKDTLEGYGVYTMKQFTEMLTVNNFPLLKNFTTVVVVVATSGGLLVVLLTMYTAVLERTREIGILKALGASPGYIMGILMREAAMLAVVGTIAGILMAYGTRALMHQFVPTMTQAIVYYWWPRAALVALVGSLAGSIYPGLKAARQDAIEALAYD